MISTRFDIAFLTLLILASSCWKTQGGLLSFGDRCKMSTYFAYLYGSLCDPYLSSVDCHVGTWSLWGSPRAFGTSCSQTRTRTIKTLARNGGQKCPNLQESKTVSCPRQWSTAQQALHVLKNGLGGFGLQSPIAGAIANLDLGPGGTTAILGSPVTVPQNRTTPRIVARRDSVSNCQPDRDIVVIVDTSGSVGKSHFQLALKGLSELIPLLCGYQQDSIQCGANRLAMITYGSTPTLAFDLNDLVNRHRYQDNVRNDIKTKPSYTGGATATGDTLKYAADRVLQVSHGMRPYSKKTILLLTDGHSNRGRDPVTVSRQLFDQYRKLSIVAVGIGTGIDYNELKNITNHHSAANALVFMTESSQSFYDIVKKIQLLLNQPGKNACSADVLAKRRK